MPSEREAPASKRLFIALPLDEPTRGTIAAVAERLRAAGLRGRFVHPENYHVTLAFLGNVRLDALEGVREAIDRAAHASAALELRLERIGAFPSERHARVVWLGPLATPAGFAQLHGALLANLARNGFTLDSKPQPHVTLCRCDGAPLPPVSLPETLALKADALALYSSLTLAGGPHYALEHRTALARVCEAKE
ncbi:MAG: RNA 2',3'-cyclic phosphodiesterase [Vulcanimicrobiaceae bacterium]